MKEPVNVRLCVVACERNVSDLLRTIAGAAAEADMIERRLDCLSDLTPATLHEVFAALPQRESRPTIVTLRSPEEGGQNRMPRNERLAFWRSSIGRLMSGEHVLVDIEADIIQELAGQNDFASVIDWRRVICSFHDFSGAHPELQNIYDDLVATPAHILKIAVNAGDATDCIQVFQVLERARRDGREMIAIAMGEAGIATRILGPSRGAFLTYASVDDETATAPGQLTARELRQVYRIERIDRHTEVFGLIGRPVSHSVSPHIQNAAFDATGLNAVYIPFETLDAAAFMRRMVDPRSREIDWNLRGLSVTAPHKSAVMAHLDWTDPIAKEIGAVNTIVVETGELRGYNTDAAAFITPLRGALGSLSNLSCAIIGAGGAARTAIWSLLQEGAAVSLFVRNPATAGPIAKEFGVDCYQLQAASFQNFAVVINATPLGTAGERQNETVADADQLAGVRLVYDLVYNPQQTRLLSEAVEAGCLTLGGLEMLLAQAAEQFELWTGTEAPVDVMREGAIQRLVSYGTP